MMIKSVSLVRYSPKKKLFLIIIDLSGGRNGYGAKVTNIFSKKFTIETSSKEFKKSFKQVS